MRARTRTIMLAWVVVQVLLAVLLAAIPLTDERVEESHPVNRRLAATLRLTDVVLTPEPVYCRHLTQADGFTPFADFPGAPEHYPAGSVVLPLALSPSSDREETQ